MTAGEGEAGALGGGGGYGDLSERSTAKIAEDVDGVISANVARDCAVIRDR